MKQFLYLFIYIALTSCATARSGYVSTADGGRLYYEERGKGQPILLLHGHSLDRRMWDTQWRPLSRHYHVVRMDFRGYGRSSEQREDLQMTHADDVLAVMDSLGLAKAHVVGLSMGAFVAGDLLAMHPERLLSCTMASGGIRSTPGPSTPMDSAESAKRDQEIAALKEKGVEQMKREWRPALTQMINDWSAWQPLHKEVRLFYAREAWQRLQERGTVSVPTLFLRGESDLKGRTFSPREAKHLNNSRIVVLPDCGHMMNMERPKDFNRSILEFLSSCPVQ